MIASRTAAQLIADAIAELIYERRNEFGILITSLTGFDIDQVIHKVGMLRTNGANIRLAVQGFEDPEHLKLVAKEAGFEVPDEFDTTLRAAGRWRNHWKESGTRVAIAPGRQPVMHTLGQFQSITNVQVAHQLLKWAQSNVAVNEQHINLLEALGTEEDFATLLNPQPVANYLASLLELDPVPRLAATFQRLWLLGLLPDPRLFGGSRNADTNNTISTRLKRNLEMVRQLRDPDQSLRTSIEKTLKQIPPPERSEIKNTLDKIDVYQHSFENALLADLTLDKVEDALRPQRVLQRLKRPPKDAEVDENPNVPINEQNTNNNAGNNLPVLNLPLDSNLEEDLNETGENNNQGVTPNPNTDKLNREKLDRHFAEAILRGDDDECDDITSALSEAIEITRLKKIKEQYALNIKDLRSKKKSTRSY